MSSPAAQAMYPALAAKEQESLPKANGGTTLPGWATSNDPLWTEPRPVPNGLDRVPGLKRIRR
jgi:hypothetical protein